MFQLDERLKSSCFSLGNWSLSTVLLKNEQNYPWFILVPRRPEIQEIYQLEPEDQVKLIQEINQLSLLIKNYYRPQKINIASLGNSVSQLHIHCVARDENDPLWPEGIWQSGYLAAPHLDDNFANKLVYLKQLIEENCL